MLGWERFKLAAVGWLGSRFVQSWIAALQIEFYGHESFFERLRQGRNALYAFWHAHMLIPAYTHRGRQAHVLVSRHRDGEAIARVVRKLGHGVVRGSTTRGGAASILTLVEKARQGYDLAITPDGPRGPRHQMQPGAVYLAQKSGLPLFPSGLAAARKWQLHSWDRFEIPKWRSPALILIGRAIHVPPDLSEDELESIREAAERQMRELTARAEQLVQLPRGERLARLPEGFRRWETWRPARPA